MAEQSMQPVDSSINSFTLEVEDVLNPPRTKEQTIAREFENLEFDHDGFVTFRRNDDLVLANAPSP